MSLPESASGASGKGQSSPEVPEAFLHLRHDALNLLDEWTAPTAALGALRVRLLHFAETHAGCMWREGGPTHFTASLVVLNSDLTHVALTLHGKAKRWFQFGGHLEAGDTTVAAAAAREGLEESGNSGLQLAPGLVQVDSHELPGAFGRCREHLDLRFAAIAPTPELGVSAESDDVRWWSLNALPPETEQSLRQAIDLSRECLRVTG